MNAFINSLLIACVVCGNAEAESIKNIYIDGHHNIHIIDNQGKNSRITSDNRNSNPKISADGSTAAWLVSGRVTRSNEESSPSELAIYKNGKIRLIRCEPFIRDYWFLKKGEQVAIDCGGLHFSGQEILFDTNTLKMMESFEQAIIPSDKRPSWSHSSDSYQPDIEISSPPPH